MADFLSKDVALGFLMHRVELKEISKQSKRKKNSKFLMHRVELKVILLISSSERLSSFLMHRVELKDQ